MTIKTCDNGTGLKTYRPLWLPRARAGRIITDRLGKLPISEQPLPLHGHVAVREVSCFREDEDVAPH